jgi:transcriptional regulator with XRE-family HTH domain
MMLPDQLRAARAMLRLGVRDVAAMARVTPGTVSRYENQHGGFHSGTMESIQRALEDCGISFLEDDRDLGPGVRFARWRSIRQPFELVTMANREWVRALTFGYLTIIRDELKDEIRFYSVIVELPGITPDLAGDYELVLACINGSKRIIERDFEDVEITNTSGGDVSLIEALKRVEWFLYTPSDNVTSDTAAVKKLATQFGEFGTQWTLSGQSSVPSDDELVTIERFMSGDKAIRGANWSVFE